MYVYVWHSHDVSFIVKINLMTPFFLVFLFFFVNQISGLGILIAGAAVLADIGDFKHFLEGRVIAPPVVLIIAGLLIFAVATLGCYGALKENPGLLMAFAVCLGIIFIFELAVGIASIAFKSDLEQSINRSLQVSIQRRSQADMIAWDPLQRRLKCCGVLGAKDWYTSNNATIPVSCCRPDHIDYTIGDCKNAASFYSDRYYAVSFAILNSKQR